MFNGMDPDEQFYDIAARELATIPRTGLLAKCMVKTSGDEKKAKAMYIEVRVGEMKEQVLLDKKRREEAERLTAKAKKEAEKVLRYKELEQRRKRNEERQTAAREKRDAQKRKKREEWVSHWDKKPFWMRPSEYFPNGLRSILILPIVILGIGTGHNIYRLFFPLPVYPWSTPPQNNLFGWSYCLILCLLLCWHSKRDW